MAPWLHVHVQSVQELRDWLSLNARHMDKHFGGSRVVCAHTHPLINTDMLTVPWHTCRIRCHANWHFQGRGLFWDGESYVSPLYCSLMSRFSQGLHSHTHTHTKDTTVNLFGLSCTLLISQSTPDLWKQRNRKREMFLWVLKSEHRVRPWWSSILSFIHLWLPSPLQGCGGQKKTLRTVCFYCSRKTHPFTLTFTPAASLVWTNLVCFWIRPTWIKST